MALRDFASSPNIRAIPSPGFVLSATPRRESSIGDTLARVTVYFRPPLTTEKINELTGLTTPTGQPLLSFDRREELYEAVGLIKDVGYDDGLLFLRDMAEQGKTAFIWELPTLKSSKRRLEREIQLKLDKKQGIRGIATCGKCGSDNIDFSQLQTAGGDESMTTFYACLNCGAHWKTR